MMGSFIWQARNQAPDPYGSLWAMPRSSETGQPWSLWRPVCKNNQELHSTVLAAHDNWSGKWGWEGPQAWAKPQG